MDDASSLGPGRPVEPPPTVWRLPDLRAAPPELAGQDLVALGADLEPGTLLAAYRGGMFPMRVRRRLGWWSPDPRGVLPLDGLVVSRSLRASCRRYRVSVDRDFEGVMRGCADRRRPDRWITEDFITAYTQLHRLGWAHSVEVWGTGPRGPELVGGLYGVSIGGLFAGESMFHRARDASKVALVALVSLLRDSGGDRLLDVQWVTDHLASLGAVPVSRRRYLARLTEVLDQPPPARLTVPTDRVVTDL
jgi:leucyl/phenylalanyl-tRNA---protein transferase